MHKTLIYNAHLSLLTELDAKLPWWECLEESCITWIMVGLFGVCKLGSITQSSLTFFWILVIDLRMAAKRSEIQDPLSCACSTENDKENTGDKIS